MSTYAAPDAPLCLPPHTLAVSPPTALPSDTCDTHFHVFKSGAPLHTPRNYTPSILTMADWRQFATMAGITRGVLVQPSVYGFDNSVLLEALATDPANLRAIVVLPPDTAPGALRELDGLGVRGVRINTRNKGGLPFDAVAALATKLAPLNWSLQFQVHPEQLPAIAALDLALPVVIDHLGFIGLDTPETDAHVSQLQRLLDRPQTYVKLSAPYRLTPGTDFVAFGAIVKKLVASHPQRLLWASDWPHTELWANMPDDARLIEQLHDWLGTDPIRRQVFSTTAQTLFFSR